MNNQNKVSYMKTAMLVFSFILSAGLANAQVNNKTFPKDSVIKVQIIDPFERAAAEQQETPDWAELTKQITDKYTAAFADRIVNKAQIFYDYGKDWAAFTAALVSYTEKYEDHNNLPLLNKNAGMVAQFSTDKKDLETALGWSTHTLDKDPGNAGYQATQDALKTKIAAQ
ncbi:MAG: hypothetical protein ACXVJD_18625 [Mucilaginibacter sp.]